MHAASGITKGALNPQVEQLGAEGRQPPALTRHLAGSGIAIAVWHIYLPARRLHR